MMLSWLFRQFDERRYRPAAAIHDEGEEWVSPERVVYDAAARLLDVQISTDDVLDTRNTGIFSVGSTVLPLTFGLLNLGDTDIPHWAVRSLVAALVFYVMLLRASWRASLFRALEFRPHLPTLWENSELHPGFACEVGLHPSTLHRPRRTRRA